jgi:hypothetical protein
MAKNLLIRMRIALLTLVGIVFMGNLLSAAELNKPILLHGKVYENLRAVFYFKTVNNPEDIENYKVLYSKGKVDDYDKLQEIKTGYFFSSHRYEIGDTLLGHFFTQEAFSKGFHSFAIYSYKGDDKSPVSNIIHVEFIEESHLFKIISKPGAIAVIDKEYTYEAEVETELEGEIKYELSSTWECENGNMGTVSFDEEKGILKYTPVERCMVHFKLIAYIEGYPGAVDEQNFYVHAQHCDEEHYISGTIVDKDDTPIRFGMAYIYQKINGEYRLASTGRIHDGFYKVPVDKGEYKLKITGPEFLDTWYDSADNMEDATVIHINCEDKDDIDFLVELRPAEEFYTCSGKVTNIHTGDPIQGAIVRFYADKPRNNGYGQGKPVLAITDENGDYEVKVSNYFHYVAFCQIADTTGDHGVKSILMYYEQTFDPTEITILTFDGDDGGINFMMPEFNNYQNSVSSKVVDEEMNPVAGAAVVAYKIGPEPLDMENPLFRAHTMTNDYGHFKFEHIYPGEYIFLIYTNDRHLIPGYYVEGDFATRDWKNATVVKVGETGEFGNFTAMLKRIKKDGGICDIRGKIRKRNGGEIKIGDGEVLGAETLNGAFVYMVDESGDVAGYSMSQYEGDYEIDQLAYGKYTLEAVKVGYEVGYAPVTLDEENPNGDMDMEMVEVITSVEDEYDFNAINAVVFPNPASNDFKVSFKSEGGEAKIEMLNVNGISISSKVVQTTSGINTITMNTNDINSGVYYLRVKLGNRTFVKNVSLIK